MCIVPNYVVSQHWSYDSLMAERRKGKRNQNCPNHAISNTLPSPSCEKERGCSCLGGIKQQQNKTLQWRIPTNCAKGIPKFIFLNKFDFTCSLLIPNRKVINIKPLRWTVISKLLCLSLESKSLQTTLQGRDKIFWFLHFYFGVQLLYIQDFNQNRSQFLQAQLRDMKGQKKNGNL